MFAPHWSLRLGPSVQLLQRWRGDPKSLLVLEVFSKSISLFLNKMIQCESLVNISDEKICVAGRYKFRFRTSPLQTNRYEDSPVFISFWSQVKDFACLYCNCKLACQHCSNTISYFAGCRSSQLFFPFCSQRLFW